MKKNYQKPKIEVIEVEAQSILCVSIIATGSVDIDQDKDASVFEVNDGTTDGGENSIWK